MSYAIHPKQNDLVELLLLLIAVVTELLQDWVKIQMQHLIRQSRIVTENSRQGSKHRQTIRTNDKAENSGNRVIQHTGKESKNQDT